jgi:hypothetical protein
MERQQSVAAVLRIRAHAAPVDLMGRKVFQLHPENTHRAILQDPCAVLKVHIHGQEKWNKENDPAA